MWWWIWGSQRLRDSSKVKQLFRSHVYLIALALASCAWDTVVESGWTLGGGESCSCRNSSTKPSSRASHRKTATWYLLASQPQNTVIRRRRRVIKTRRVKTQRAMRSSRIWKRWMITVSSLMMESHWGGPGRQQTGSGPVDNWGRQGRVAPGRFHASQRAPHPMQNQLLVV